MTLISRLVGGASKLELIPAEPAWPIGKVLGKTRRSWTMREAGITPSGHIVPMSYLAPSDGIDINVEPWTLGTEPSSAGKGKPLEIAHVLRVVQRVERDTRP